MPIVSLPHKPTVVAISLAVAALHLVTGADYSGPLRAFVTGYLIDLTLPFALVLLLWFGFEQVPTLHRPFIRAIIVVLIGAVVEGCQYFGIPVFGRTFDPLDLVMYTVGALAAVLFERAVFASTPPPSR